MAKKSVHTASTVRTTKKTNTRKSTSRKTNTKKRSTKRRSKKNTPISIFVIITPILILAGLFLIYMFAFFPRILNQKIKDELSAVYEPVNINDAENIFILKLEKRPVFELQQKAYEIIKNKHGLDIEFEKIHSKNQKGINRLRFYRNKREFKDICPVYIYWDKEIKKTIIASRNKVKDKTIIPQSTKKKKKPKPKIVYEKIEEKRKNEKKDKIKPPVTSDYKKVISPPRLKTRDKVKIAIVIDDVGYSYNSTYDFLSLGFPVTFAIIPDMPRSKEFYNLFKKFGYEVILHIPMEPLKGKKYVESNGLFTDLSEKEIRNRVKTFLNTYPAAKGANNHMGSKAVTDASVMNVLLGELSLKNKYWLDSMTNTNTISHEIASVYNLSYFERDVFLDNSKDPRSIKNYMDNLVEEARKKGEAIGIGHIQTKELVPILKEYYNNREALGIEFVSLSNL